MWGTVGTPSQKQSHLFNQKTIFVILFTVYSQLEISDTVKWELSSLDNEKCE